MRRVPWKNTSLSKKRPVGAWCDGGKKKEQPHDVKNNRASISHHGEQKQGLGEKKQNIFKNRQKKRKNKSRNHKKTKILHNETGLPAAPASGAALVEFLYAM